MTPTVRIGIGKLAHIVWFLATLASAQDTARKLLLWTWSSQPMAPGLVAALRTEIEHMPVAGFGQVEMLSGTTAQATARDLLINVQINGSCNPNHVPFASGEAEPLGYVVQTSGRIEPTVFVNCGQILSAIRPFVLEQPKRFQEMLLARALVRVIRHELRHVLEQTIDHLTKGIFKAHLQPLDLVAQPGY